MLKHPTTALAFLLLLVLFSPTRSHAQILFQRTLGATGIEEANDLALADSGRYALTGFTESFSSSRDLLLTLRDSNAAPIWSYASGPTNTDEIAGAAVWLDGYLYVAGQTTESNPGQINGFLQKWDATGNLLGTRTCGTTGGFERYFDVDANADGFLYTSGFTFLNGIDMFISKWDTNLNLIWSRSVGLANSVELGTAGVATSDGGYVMGGTTNSGLGGDDLFIVKLDSTGALVWSRIVGSMMDETITDVIELNHRYFVAGYRFNGGSRLFEITPIDTNGNVGFLRDYGVIGINELEGIAGVGGKIYATGKVSATTIGSGSDVGFVMRVDTSGPVDFAYTYGTSGNESFRDIAVLPNGDFLAAGTSNAIGAGLNEVFLLRSDSLGNANCNLTSLSLPRVSILRPNQPHTAVAQAAGSSASKTWPVSLAVLQPDTYCVGPPPPCIFQTAATLNDTLFCPGDTLIATDITVGNTSREWLANGMPFAGSINPLAAVLVTPGPFTLSLVTSDGSCRDTLTFNLETQAAVPPVLSQLDLCLGQALTATNTTPGATGSVWSISGNVVDTGLVAQITPPVTGTYAIELTSLPSGCTSETDITVLPAPSPNFSFVLNGLTAAFTDLSTGGSNYFWSFGDGATSTQPNPSHIYATPGTYEVCLVLLNAANCQDTLCQMIDVLVARESPIASRITLAPNPARDALRIHLPATLGEVALSCFSSAGQCVGQWRRDAASDPELTIDLHGLAAGVYQLRVVGNGISVDRRFVKW
ncbi:MAG: PKD domain-containing protein [Bacteroidota bacterium]